MTVSVHRNNVIRLDAFKDAATKVRNNLGRNINHAGNIDDVLNIRNIQTHHSQSLVHDFLNLLQSARSVKNPSIPHESAKAPEKNKLEAESAKTAKANIQSLAGAGGEKISSSTLAQLSTALQECPSSVTYLSALKQAAMADLAADLSAEKSLSKPACNENELKRFNRQLKSSDKDEIAQKKLDDFLIMRHLIKKDGLDENQTKKLNQVTGAFIKFVVKNGLDQFSAAAGAMGKHGDKAGKLKEFNELCNQLAAINDEKSNFTLNKDIAQEIHAVLEKYITSNSDIETIIKNVNNFLRESYREHTNIRQVIMEDNSTGLFDKKRTLFNHESLVLDLLKKSMDKIADTGDKEMQKPVPSEPTPKANAGETQPGVYAPFIYIDNSIHYHYGAQPAMANSGEKASDQKDKLLNQFADTQATTNVLLKGGITQDQDLISGLDETDDVGGSYDEQSKEYAFADNTGDKPVLVQAEGGTTEELQETLSEPFNNETLVSDSVSFSVQPEGNPTQPLSVSEPQEVYRALKLQTASDEIRQEGGFQNGQQPEMVPHRHFNSPLADSQQNTPKRNNVMMGNSTGTQPGGSQIVRERNNKSGQSIGEVQTNESTPSDENQGLDRWGRRTYLQQQSESEKATGRSGYQRNRQAIPNVVSTNGVAGDIAGRFNNSTGLVTQRTSEPSANGERPVNLAHNARQNNEVAPSTAQHRTTPVRSSQLQNSASVYQQPVQKRGDMLNDRRTDEVQTNTSAASKDNQGLDRWGRRTYLQQQSESEKATGRSGYQRNRQATPNVVSTNVVAGDIAGRFNNSTGPVTQRTSEPSANGERPVNLTHNVRQNNEVAPSIAQHRTTPVRSSQLQNSVSAVQQPVQKRGGMLNDRRIGEAQTATSVAPKENQGLDTRGRRTYLQQQSESEKATGRSGYRRNRQATPNVVSPNGVAGDITRRFTNSHSLAPLKASEASIKGEAHTDSSLVTGSWTDESAELKTTSEKDRPENRNDIHHAEQEIQWSEPQFYRRKIYKAVAMQNPAFAEDNDFADQGKPMPVKS